MAFEESGQILYDKELAIANSLCHRGQRYILVGIAGLPQDQAGATKY